MLCLSLYSFHEGACQKNTRTHTSKRYTNTRYENRFLYGSGVLLVERVREGQRSSCGLRGKLAELGGESTAAQVERSTTGSALAHCRGRPSLMCAAVMELYCELMKNAAGCHNVYSSYLMKRNVILPHYFNFSNKLIAMTAHVLRCLKC